LFSRIRVYYAPQFETRAARATSNIKHQTSNIPSGSCREAHQFLFAYYGDRFPGPGLKSFLHIFSGALDQEAAGKRTSFFLPTTEIGRLPNTPGHCSYDRVSKTKSTDKVNALDNPHVVLLLCDGGPSLTREEAAAFALLVARSRILADLSVISVYVSVVVPLRAFCASIINDRQPISPVIFLFSTAVQARSFISATLATPISTETGGASSKKKITEGQAGNRRSL